MICPDTDFLIDLYEMCLTSSDGPYTVMGEHICENLGLFGLSVWSQHPYVRGASSRIVFFQREQNVDLVIKDQVLAGRVLDEQTVLQGSHNGLCYWAGILCGTYARSALVVWSVEPFSRTCTAFLEKFSSRLTVLLDLIALMNPVGFNRVARELESTRFIQNQLMPPLNALGGKRFLSYRTLPVHELGGDYLDIISYRDGSVGLAVADAMGKGVPGAFVMLIARTIFRFIAKEKIPPHIALTALNNQFITEVSAVDTFVTQFFCIYDPTQQSLLYSNAGHNPPVIFSSQEGRVGVLSGRGIALGGKEGASYQSYATRFEAGDILVIFSDGLPDARNESEQQFGLQGIMDTVIRYKEYSADGICDGLTNRVMQHCKSQTDDISFLVLKGDQGTR
jgi:hypothetical protein